MVILILIIFARSNVLRKFCRQYNHLKATSAKLQLRNSSVVGNDCRIFYMSISVPGALTVHHRFIDEQPCL